MRAVALLLLLAGGAAAAVPRPDPCRVREQLFLSPAGEPFRSAPGAPAPVALWFGQADVDRDGRLTEAEVRADAVRFLATTDGDRDGQMIPDELALYERSVPEISIYSDAAPERRSGRTVRYGAPIGGARYALSNVPNPIAAADIDMNRATTRAELSDAAARIYTGIAGDRTGLALADLPATPQAMMLAQCAARAARGRR